MKSNAQQPLLPAAANAESYVDERLIEQARAIVDANRAVLEIEEQPPRAVTRMRDPGRAKQIARDFLENEILEDTRLGHEPVACQRGQATDQKSKSREQTLRSHFSVFSVAIRRD